MRESKPCNYCGSVAINSDNYQKLLDFVKRVSSGCDGDPLETLCDLEDDAEILLREIGEA